MRQTHILTSSNTGLMAVIVMMMMASCNITRHYERPANVTDSTLYRGSTTTDSTTIADIPWMQLFSDPNLQSLIQEGINNNLDLKIAVARIKAAAANFQQSKLAFIPSLSSTASATEQKLSAAQGAGFAAASTYQLSLSSSWEADIWGKLRSTKRAYLSALLQSDAYRRAVQTQLIADIATNYYALLAYDAQLAITEKTVENRKADVVTMKILKESDVVTGAAVVQSAANRYSVEVTIPDLQLNIRQTENAICILLGRRSDSIPRTSLESQAVLTDLNTGVPAQLLANRPDVQQAEYQLRYYFELTNVARTYFYPKLSITAQGGWASIKVHNLFDASSIFGNVVGSLTQPIFNQGLNTQRLKVAAANQEEFLFTFEKTLLTAGQEVSNALYTYQTAGDKMALRTEQIAYLQKSVDYTKELLKYTSNTNYTDVLTSEQSLLAAQLSSISDKLQQLQAVVSLYRSLGGGWKQL